MLSFILHEIVIFQQSFGNSHYMAQRFYILTCQTNAVSVWGCVSIFDWVHTTWIYLSVKPTFGAESLWGDNSDTVGVSRAFFVVSKHISPACDPSQHVLHVFSLFHPPGITEHKYSIISQLLISCSFPIPPSLPTAWNSFTSYKPSLWWGCRATLCSRTACASWLEVELCSRALSAGRKLVLKKIYNNITRKCKFINSCETNDIFFFFCFFLFFSDVTFPNKTQADYDINVCIYKWGNIFSSMYFPLKAWC